MKLAGLYREAWNEGFAAHNGVFLLLLFFKDTIGFPRCSFSLPSPSIYNPKGLYGCLFHGGYRSFECVSVDVYALFLHLSSRPILQYKAVLPPTLNKPFGPIPAFYSLPNFQPLIYKKLLIGFWHLLGEETHCLYEGVQCHLRCPSGVEGRGWAEASS